MEEKVVQELTKAELIILYSILIVGAVIVFSLMLKNIIITSKLNQKKTDEKD